MVMLDLSNILIPFPSEIEVLISINFQSIKLTHNPLKITPSHNAWLVKIDNIVKIRNTKQITE